MICKASIVSAIYVVKFQKNAEDFLAKKPSVCRKCGGFFCLPQMRKMKKNRVARRLEPGISFSTVHRSSHYSIPPSLESKPKIVYIKKTQKNNFELEKNL